MSPHDDTGEKLPDEKICELVFEAGYNGMAIDLGASDVKKAFELQPLMEKIGLTPLIVAFPKTINSLGDTMKMAKDFGSPFINVIGQVMPISVDGMIPVIRKWIDMADKIGIPIQFETHRNCITNDLYSTLQLLDAIPEMRMCSDLSHYVVDREFWYPLSERDLGMISRILDRSDSFQGRVASRQQIQLQIDFPQHQKWVNLFKDWWYEGIEKWRLRNSEGTCYFLCELGPPEYAMTDKNGKELSNRWEEALKIKLWIEDIWKKSEVNVKKSDKSL